MPKFLSNIDLNQNEIQNVRIHNVGSDPTSNNGGGRMIYNTGSNQLKYYDAGSTSWVTIGSGSGGDPNQNAFSNVVVGSDTIAADSTTDTLTLVAGTGITLSADTGADSVTITSSVTNTDVDVNKTNLSARLAQFDGTETLNIGDADNDTSVVIRGNLTVNGTTTSVNSNTVNIGDNIIVLNSDETGTPSQNAGVEVERGTESNVQIRWNEADDDWEYTAFDHQGTPAIQTYKIPRTFSDTIGDASATSINVDHNLGQTAVLVQLFDTSTGETVFAEVTRTSTNRVNCAFAVAPGSGAITVLISTV